MKVWTLLTVSLLCVQCGGPQLQNSHYSDGQVSFDIGKLPADWKQLDIEDGNDLAWQSARSGAVIQLNASCDPGLDIPLPALRNHLLIGFTERSFQHEQTIMLVKREALKSELTAKLDGQVRALVLVVLKKDGCVYDFALIGRPSEQFEQSHRDFQTFLSGFQV
ncbi:MAG: hypothetical protein IPJ88_06795 [Myxococcales bacterium]|nr:MAG: hypothetical protein IPJ88_06795 [Myxococcales bacterium]